MSLLNIETKTIVFKMKMGGGVGGESLTRT